VGINASQTPSVRSVTPFEITQVTRFMWHLHKNTLSSIKLVLENNFSWIRTLSCNDLNTINFLWRLILFVSHKLRNFSSVLVLAHFESQ
jgi:hypothetical protein